MSAAAMSCQSMRLVPPFLWEAAGKRAETARRPGCSANRPTTRPQALTALQLTGQDWAPLMSLREQVVARGVAPTVGRCSQQLGKTDVASSIICLPPDNPSLFTAIFLLRSELTARLFSQYGVGFQAVSRSVKSGGRATSAAMTPNLL